jgi:hypothetical protein
MNTGRRVTTRILLGASLLTWGCSGGKPAAANPSADMPKDSPMVTPKVEPQPATPSSSTTITVEGVAHRAKMGAMIKTDDGDTHWVDLGDWPPDVLGKRVRVTGEITIRSDLPVFVAKKGEPMRAGMPVPEGTDLKQASRRQVLKNIKWEIVDPNVE